MLRKFMSGRRDAIALVESALFQEEWPVDERVAHTLKGVAGNLGATQVQGDAAALEEALHQRAANDVVVALAHQANKSLSALLGALQAQLPQVAQVSVSDADAGQLQVLVAELKHLLRNDDAAAVDLFSDHAALLKFAYPNSFQ